MGILGNFRILMLLFLVVTGVNAQRPKVFTIADFDLKGDVEQCEVITSYGREIFKFDELGRLVSATTRYNGQDWDVSHYIFKDSILKEKRVESYKQDVLDLSSSMAHIYTIDSTQNRLLTEDIISYDKEFMERQEYHYDEIGQLQRMVTSHKDGVDELTLEHKNENNSETVTYFENGLPQKSICTTYFGSPKKPKGSKHLVKTFIDGTPSEATEKTFDPLGQLLTEESFSYDPVKQSFVSDKKELFRYKKNVLTNSTVNDGKSIVKREYIFQFDGNEPKNWVKKITLPDNSYVTRKIKYFTEQRQIGSNLFEDQ